MLKKNVYEMEIDTLFDTLSSYHPNTKFTLAENPKKFLDTQISKQNNKIKKNALSKSLCNQSIGPQ